MMLPAAINVCLPSTHLTQENVLSAVQSFASIAGQDDLQTFLHKTVAHF